MRAYSLTRCYLGVLRAQSKVGKGMSGMQMLHDVCQNCVKFFIGFRVRADESVAFLRQVVVFCKCKMNGQRQVGRGKPLADVPFSC